MENNEEMEFREWLQSEMDARRIGPSDLARMAKVPQPTIFRILSGETKDPRTGTVKRLERALGAGSPPIDDADSDQYKVVAEFTAVYRGSTEEGRDFLRKAIMSARVMFVGVKPTPHLTVAQGARKSGKKD